MNEIESSTREANEQNSIEQTTKVEGPESTPETDPNGWEKLDHPQQAEPETLEHRDSPQGISTPETDPNGSEKLDHPQQFEPETLEHRDSPQDISTPEIHEGEVNTDPKSDDLGVLEDLPINTDGAEKTSIEETGEMIGASNELKDTSESTNESNGEKSQEDSLEKVETAESKEQDSVDLGMENIDDKPKSKGLLNTLRELSESNRMNTNERDQQTESAEHETEKDSTEDEENPDKPKPPIPPAGDQQEKTRDGITRFQGQDTERIKRTILAQNRQQGGR